MLENWVGAWAGPKVVYKVTFLRWKLKSSQVTWTLESHVKLTWLYSENKDMYMYTWHHPIRPTCSLAEVERMRRATQQTARPNSHYIDHHQMSFYLFLPLCRLFRGRSSQWCGSTTTTTSSSSFSSSLAQIESGFNCKLKSITTLSATQQMRGVKKYCRSGA